jgi:hypothetical protein
MKGRPVGGGNLAEVPHGLAIALASMKGRPIKSGDYGVITLTFQALPPR